MEMLRNDDVYVYFPLSYKHQSFIFGNIEDLSIFVNAVRDLEIEYKIFKGKEIKL